MLPSWLAENPKAKASKNKRSLRFVEGALTQTSRFIENIVFAEQMARQTGFLQHLDARIKLLSLLALIVAAAFCHHLPSLWLIAVFITGAALVSNLRPAMVFNRVWWLLPGVFVIVAAPAALNLITPGDPLFIIYRISENQRWRGIHLPAEVSITQQGLAAAVMLVTRIGVGVLLTVTITLTTRWQSLLRAAYTEATASFVLILAMTYRYIFVLVRVVEEMHLARRARTISPANLASERKWAGNRIGALFLRSRVLTERVYAAMLARGYTGRPRALTSSRFGWRETVWLICCAIVIVISLVFDRVLLGDFRW